MKKFKLEDRVLYKQGSRENLYGKKGVITYLGEGPDGLIQIQFDDGKVCNCLPSNLDILKDHE